MTPTLRALLEKHLKARRFYLAVLREMDDYDEEQTNYHAEEADEAERALQDALMRAHGLDPKYTTPRPIAANVDGYLITLVPDPNGSAIAERGGRAFPDSWKDADVFSVIPPSDVLTEAKKGRFARGDQDGGRDHDGI